MKNLFAFLFVLLLALAGQRASAQTIRRVNNNGITGTNIYANAQAAHDAATAGDIIQLEPSTTSYGSLTCSKNLTIVGTGYFLSQNQPPALQANVVASSIDNVYFVAGSSGATMSGVTVVATAHLGASNVSFLRNIVQTLYIGYLAPCSNLLARQNYITSSISVYQNLACNNMLFTNNIVIGSVNLSSATYNGEFSNNVVLGGSSFDNFTLRNNYLGPNLSTTANTTWQYNFLTQATLPALGSQSNNTANVPQANVFVLAPTGPGQFDAWYKLKVGSSASGAGQGGVDIGAFGSATGFAYRLAGIPAIPTIYQLSQSVSGNTLNVNVSTRSNN